MVKINLLSIGAAKIETKKKTMYIDAFAHHVQPFEVNRVNYILVTHDDGDHFAPNKVVAGAKINKAMVIGPPSVTYPLLVDEKLPPSQLKVFYPPQLSKPDVQEFDEIKITIFQTRHFNGWEPIHISYLIEVEEKKIYFTGDSYTLDENHSELHNLDALIYSLVPPEEFHSKMIVSTSPEYKFILSKQAHQLIEVQKTFEPKIILPNHLIQCNWTVNPADLQVVINEYNNEGVVIFNEVTQSVEV